MRRFAALIVGVFAVLTAAAAVAAPRDVAFRLVVDGRTFDRESRPSGVLHDGVAYVDVVDGVRAVGGLLRFEPGGDARVTVRGRWLGFAPGRSGALLDTGPMPLAGAPFERGGDLYVPLASVATLAEAKLTLDWRGHRALLALGAGPGFDASPRDAGEVDDIAPSPTQALAFVTTGTVDRAGLHARVAVRNVTANPYVLRFPSAKTIGFVVWRNGAPVWNSTDAILATEPAELTIPAGGTIVVASDDANFERFGPGRYLMRVRLMTSVPIDLSPISLGLFPES